MDAPLSPTSRVLLAAVRELIDLTARVPRVVDAEGLPTIARRWCVSPEAIELADLIAEMTAVEELGCFEALRLVS